MKIYAKLYQLVLRAKKLRAQQLKLDVVVQASYVGATALDLQDIIKRIEKVCGPDSVIMDELPDIGNFFCISDVAYSQMTRHPDKPVTEYWITTAQFPSTEKYDSLIKFLDANHLHYFKSKAGPVRFGKEYAGVRAWVKSKGAAYFSIDEDEFNDIVLGGKGAVSPDKSFSKDLEVDLMPDFTDAILNRLHEYKSEGKTVIWLGTDKFNGYVVTGAESDKEAKRYLAKLHNSVPDEPTKITEKDVTGHFVKIDDLIKEYEAKAAQESKERKPGELDPDADMDSTNVIRIDLYDPKDTYTKLHQYDVVNVWIGSGKHEGYALPGVSTDAEAKQVLYGNKIINFPVYGNVYNLDDFLDNLQARFMQTP